MPFNDASKAEALIRKDVSIMKQKVQELLNQRAQIDQQIQQFNDAIAQWSGLLTDETPAHSN